MRILMLNANIRETGTYYRCFYFGRELARGGHDVTMMTVAADSPYRSKEYRKAGVRVIEGASFLYKSLPGWGWSPLDIAARLKETIDGRYDVVYGFETLPNVAIPAIVNLLGPRRRYVSDWADWYAGVHRKWKGIRLLQTIDAAVEEHLRLPASDVTVICRRLRQRAIACGVRPARVHYIKQGTDVELIRPMDRIEARRRMGIDESRPTLVIIADEAMVEAVKIFQGVLRRYPDALMIAIGTIHHGAQRTAEAWGIAGSVRFAGRCPDDVFVRLLACADVCFLPLKDSLLNWGRWPHKVNDYLAAGRAAVINDVGDVADLFREAEVGYLVRQDLDAFVDRLCALLKDRDLRETMGGNGRRLVEERYDWRVIGDRVREVFS